MSASRSSNVQQTAMRTTAALVMPRISSEPAHFSPAAAPVGDENGRPGDADQGGGGRQRQWDGSANAGQADQDGPGDRVRQEHVGADRVADGEPADAACRLHVCGVGKGGGGCHGNQYRHSRIAGPPCVPHNQVRGATDRCPGGWPYHRGAVQYLDQEFRQIQPG